MESNLPLLTAKYKINWDIKSQSGYSNDYEFVDYIRNSFRIVAEGIGTPKTSRRQNKILLKPFILNKYEVFYLYHKYEYFLIFEM